MIKVFKIGDIVQVVKKTSTSNAICKEVGEIINSAGDSNLFWIVRLNEETYTDDSTGTLIHGDELQIVRTKVKFGQFEIRLKYSDNSFDRGWSYHVHHVSENKLTLQEDPFTYGKLPQDDYGMSFEYAILDAKERTLKAVKEQIRLKRLHVQILESAMQSIEAVGAKA